MISKFDIGIFNSQPRRPFKMTFSVIDNDSITLPTISTGSYHYVVDWGDGTSDLITTYNDPARVHTYTTAGDYQVSIRGKYSTQSFYTVQDSKDKLISVDSWGVVGLNSFLNLFRGCSNLASLPSAAIPSNTATSFSSTFQQCASLTSIPTGLFDNCPDATDFTGTFHSTSLTSIPTGLFDNCPNATNFASTFNNASLTSIPTGLFDNCPDVINFTSTFFSTDITSIPTGLFDNCLSVTEFVNTFGYCTSLGGSAPELWLRNPNSPTYDTGDPDGQLCFQQATGLTNYADIPTYWK